MSECIYDSANFEFKTPFGAVAEGTGIFFRILVPRHYGCTAAQTVFYRDGEEDDPQYHNMFWAGMCGSDYEWWDVTVTPNEWGLYFYRFRCDTPGGQVVIRRDQWGEVVVSRGERGHDWQQTVYKKDFTTPDWLAGGIIYQIFPDRFFVGGKEKSNVPNDRVLRDDWGGEPYFRPDERGIVRNNDYFGGDLEGITKKLPYLKSLGVTCVYLNPIFEAQSNHRYDTACYERIDPLLGNEADFRRLCREAKKLGIRVILDGVFSHTGADSVYFNAKGRYDSVGAANSRDSEYYDWYSFSHWPDKYESWWGIDILPNVREDDPKYIEYISGKNGILKKWQKAGAGGYRLDVADELPDVFLDALRKSVKEQDKNAVIIGEVWEDASNKCSYGYRRRYLLGDQLDSVMNYVFAGGIIGFVKNGNAGELHRTVMSVLENYPPQVVRLLMNHLGTHDTVRIMTMLAGDSVDGHDREWQSGRRLSDEQYAAGVAMLKVASAIQYTLPGVPSIYYGDEAGAQGYADPFNRACYPWGAEDGELVEWYRTLGKMRADSPALREGEYVPVATEWNVYAFLRIGGGKTLLTAVNRSSTDEYIEVKSRFDHAHIYIGSAPKNGVLHLPPYGVCILECSDGSPDDDDDEQEE